MRFDFHSATPWESDMPAVPAATPSPQSVASASLRSASRTDFFSSRLTLSPMALEAGSLAVYVAFAKDLKVPLLSPAVLIE